MRLHLLAAALLTALAACTTPTTPPTDGPTVMYRKGAFITDEYGFGQVGGPLTSSAGIVAGLRPHEGTAWLCGATVDAGRVARGFFVRSRAYFRDELIAPNLRFFPDLNRAALETTPLACIDTGMKWDRTHEFKSLLEIRLPQTRPSR